MLSPAEAVQVKSQNQMCRYTMLVSILVFTRTVKSWIYLCVMQFGLLFLYFQFDINHSILLTGTPIQNNLKELYSLLSFVAPKIFRKRYLGEFVENYSSEQSKTSKWWNLTVHTLQIALVNTATVTGSGRSFWMSCA